jgi:hypothetical protein
MPETLIKSGNELVSDFLELIADNTNVDATTLACIVTLRDQGKLTKNRLLTSLQTARADGNPNDKD